MYYETDAPAVVNAGNNGWSNGLLDIVVLLAVLGGFGNWGFGGGSGASANYTLASDFATIQRQLSEGFTDTRSGIINIGNGLADFGYTTQTLANNIQRSVDGVNYNMAQNTCQITNAINSAARDVVENANANYRSIHDELIAFRLEDKNAKIAEQQAMINSLQLAASQERQNAYLISELRPCAKPAYITCSPFASAYGTCCNNGCGSIQ